MEFSIKKERKRFSKQGIFHTGKNLALKLKSYFPENINKIYDPTCGAGDLLAVFGDDVEKYGQEIQEEFLQYAKNRLVNFHGYCGDTLKAPFFKDENFDYIIANPPFSVSWEPFQDERFLLCEKLPPKTKADYAFILHCIHYMRRKAVVLCYPGILYRGNSEYYIRKSIVDNNLIERIVLNPKNQFEDTNINTITIVFSKEKENTDIIFEGLEREISKSVKLSDIKGHDYNLSVNYYLPIEGGKEQIDPIGLEKDIRDNIKKNIDRELTLSKLIMQFEDLEFNYFLEELKKIINSHKITKKEKTENNTNQKKLLIN